MVWYILPPQLPFQVVAPDFGGRLPPLPADQQRRAGGVLLGLVRTYIALGMHGPGRVHAEASPDKRAAQRVPCFGLPVDEHEGQDTVVAE